MKTLLVVFLVAAAASSAAAQAPAKKKIEPAENAAKMSTYVVGLLYKGPNWTAGKNSTADSLQAGHMANIQKMAEMGKLMAAGPMGDTGQLRGVFIFRADSIAEVKPLAEADPSVKAGRLKIDYHVWWGQKGIGEKYAAEHKKNPDMKVEMTTYQLVFLVRSDKADSLSAQEGASIQQAHLQHIFSMLDSKKAAVAGAFLGDHDIRGIIVFQTGSLDEAKKLAESDPAVKAGRMKVEIHSWWAAKGIWPE